MERWKENLSPFDYELCLMVESLTENECEPKNGGDHYFIEADYSKHNDPDYIAAVQDAIEGRVGKRLLELKDDPERHCLFVRIKFEKNKYPVCIGDERDHYEPEPYVGMVYCRQDGVVYALEVNDRNREKLHRFVGGGQTRIAEDGTVSHHFLTKKGMFVDAPQGSYIVSDMDGNCRVVKGENFREYISGSK